MVPPLTEEGKQVALTALAERRANRPIRVENDRLPAGSAMWFYCKACGHVAGVLGELYQGRPPQLCAECDALKSCGWLE